MKESLICHLKIMITLRIMNEKRKQSVLDEIKETEKYGFQTLEERLPVGLSSLNVQFVIIIE